MSEARTLLHGLSRPTKSAMRRGRYLLVRMSGDVVAGEAKSVCIVCPFRCAGKPAF